MHRSQLIVAILATLLVASVLPSLADEVGYCVLQATANGPSVGGSITFTTDATNVLVVASITGLPRDGNFAIHVHEFGDLSDTSAGLSAGGHYIGTGSATHGCPDGSNLRHEGDMGNWQSTNGVIQQQKLLDILSLSSAGGSIIGRAVIVHSQVDSCDGEVGNAGSRLAFCVVGIKNSVSNVAQQNAGTPINTAICTLRGTTNCPSCSGTVYLTQKNSNTIRVTAQVNGLTLNSVHGLHIHQFGDLSASDGTSLGPHWNPGNKKHGLPPSTDRHEGDLGNIQSYDSSTGSAWYQLDNTFLSSIASVVGRGVVVHELQDSGAGYGCDEATGSAGKRLAVCVIGIANTNSQIPTSPITVDTDFHNVDCLVPPDDHATSLRVAASLLVVVLALVLLMN